MNGLSPMTGIIADIRMGKMVILVDDEDRENEGDIILAADFVTPELINFMAKYARGLICLTLTEQRCQQLNLPLMVNNNGSSHGTNFTLSIEAAEGVSTGISAADRARTIQAAVARHAKPSDIVQPGHIFPLKAQNGGVLVRAGHTEAGCDLAGLAGLTPAAVICEIMNDDGTMARLPELIAFAQEHGLKVGTIADLIAHRSQTESLITHVAERPVKTAWGEFILHAFRDESSMATHLAIVKGKIMAENETLVRVHEPLSVVDWLDIDEHSHSWSVPQVLQKFAQSEQGVLILLHSTESGDDLLARTFPNTAPAVARKWDPKTYGIGAQMLRTLGVGKMRLMSKPLKIPSMTGFHLEVSGYVLPDGSLL